MPNKSNGKKPSKKQKEALNKGRKGRSKGSYENVGRPSIMTSEVINKLEFAFSIGASDTEACYHAGISHQTLWNYQTKNPEFLENKERLKSKTILLSRIVLLEGILGKVDDYGNVLVPKSPELALKYLERKRKKEFSTRVETETKQVDDFDLEL